MSTNQFMKLIGHCLFFVLFYSCAQVASPSGGPKDIIPPRVERYEPDSAARNFSSKKIIIRFDENIQLKEIGSQLLISPPLSVSPEVKVKNKVLTVELKEDLKPNTTYNIYFGNAVRDINEENTLKDFSYVFSTGNSIDSLRVQGIVRNAYDLKMEKNVLVMLYDRFEDSLPYKGRPSFYTRTRDDGSFTISNVRAGAYKIFAFKDLNSNFMCDPDEPLAFSADTVYTERSGSQVMNLFKEPPSLQYIKKAWQAEYGKLVLSFNLPVKNVVFSPLGSVPKGEWKIEELNRGRDTLILWIPALSQDSLKADVADNGKSIGSFFLKLRAKEEIQKSGRGERAGLYINTNISPEKSFDLNMPLYLVFNHPLKNDDLLSVLKIKEDSLELKKDELSIEKRSLREYAIFKKANPTVLNKDSVPIWKEDAVYSFEIPGGSLQDILGNANDTVKMKFKTNELKAYGNLRMKIKMKKVQYNCLFQLMDEKGTVVKRALIREDKVLDFYLLNAGKYSARIIYDKNENGLWDTGKYMENQQPEKVIYLSGAISIRSNWDLDLEWIVD